jgi:hypothetical protein
MRRLGWLWMSCSKVGGLMVEALWVSTASCAQVVFATLGLGTSMGGFGQFVRSFHTRFCTYFSAIYWLDSGFLHAFHSTNNMSYKKEIK